MDKNEFLREQFITLRAEIKATKQRAFLIVLLGLISIPIIAFLAEQQQLGNVAPMLPFLVMVLAILFVAEQNALMRCGHFIRENIEPKIEGASGWEAWLESNQQLRLLDKNFVGCFMVVFFVFYFISVGVAIDHLWTVDAQFAPAQWRGILGGVTYGIGAVWMVITTLHHWKSYTTTQV
ncbi:MAG: hypothetical protein L6Q92_13270 [Phycisphaerae bacterium]|nr:hypothetical protein [Phycisphaerae bacterium]